MVGLGMSCRRPAVARWLRRWRCTPASNPTPSEAPEAIALTSPPAQGYTAASVTDVVRAAAVSRSTFYELFASKEACFLEAYRTGVEVLDERVGHAVRTAADDWRAQLRAGIRVYLDMLAADQAFT